MKIAITQGHAKGIGLEVFFKSCLLLGRHTQHFQLFASKEAVINSISSINLPFQIRGNYLEFAGVKLEVSWQKSTSSFDSLVAAMKYCEESSSILFTLPTSKDEFPNYPGHTEFFRYHYNVPELGMFFSSPTHKFLLITDHISLAEVSAYITEELLRDRIINAVKTLESWHWPINRIFISGLNPHAGENGLIGNEEKIYKKVIKELRSKLEMDISGPYPGDTMLLESKSPNDLLVYMYHDQGLGIFKAKQGFIGSNITLGLPYPRFSPDHGTSFSLYGKNQADYRGCSYSLKEALELREKLVHGIHSGKQSKSSQSKKH